MKVITITASALPSRLLVIGYVGENERTQVRIDCTAILTEYPHASPTLAIKPPVGAVYPVVVSREENEVVWDVSNADLQNEGDGELQLTFTKDGVVAKTVIGKLRISRSLLVTGEQPDVIQTWYDAATEKLAEVDAQIVELEGMVDTATDAATRAEQSEDNATTAAANAATSAATASTKAAEAQASANTATAKASEAALSATQARNSAMSAANSESGATAKAAEAAQSAQTATTKAGQATEAAQTATGKAEEASASATAAQTSATNAASSATAASASETAAKASETAASTSATQAGTSAQNAGTAAQTATQKAEEAASSATNAAASATSAATSAETASTKAGEAAQSAQAVAETAEQLADSLEQIEQNTQDIADLDERKANIDGYYPDMTVGNAEQLNSSKFVQNSEPYTLRTSGGSSDIGNREYVDAVVGGTLAWNQMVRDEASENSTDFADVVTVTDAVEDAAGVKVKIEPVQDLHGYSNPWPGGGGKNKFCDVFSEYTKPTDYYVFPITLAEGTYRLWVSKTKDTVTGCAVGIAKSGSRYTDFDGLVLAMTTAGNTNSTVLTVDSTWTDPKLCVYCGGEAAFNSIFENYNVQLESGAMPTSFEPYANICPITGWDGVQVWDDPKHGGLIEWNQQCNVLAIGGDTSDLTFTFGNNGSVKISGTSNKADWKNIKMFTGIADHILLAVASPAFPEGFSLGAQYSDTRRSCMFLRETGNMYLRFSFTSGTVMDYDGYVNIFDLTQMFGDTKANEINSLEQATYGAGLAYFKSLFPADYYPYNAGEITTVSAVNSNPYRHYSITLPTEAGTVYGGELTVNADGSGSLVVDRAEITFDGSNDETFSSGASGMPLRCYLPSNAKLSQASTALTGMSSNQLKEVTQSSAWGTNGTFSRVFMIPGQDYVVYFKINDAITTVTQLRAYLAESPLTFVYELATPLTYTLTASEIRTLLGTNNVWSDAGQTALTYTGTDEHLTLESGKKYLARISGTDSMLLGSGQEITAAKGTDNVFDLTKMFGTAVADYVYGQGAAFFRKWFPSTRYPYNAGQLKHVEGLQSHDMVGFNVFDKDMTGITARTYLNADGTTVTNGSWSLSDYIPIVGSMTYYARVAEGASPAICWYDANKNYIGGVNYSTLRTANKLFTLPDNAQYIRVSFQTTLVNDICINLAHNNSRNGEYAPYEKHSYPLDSTLTLRGIPKVGRNGVYWDGDEYGYDGAVKRRYGVVDLGTLNWSYYQDSIFYSQSLAAIAENGTNVVCTKYLANSVPLSNPTDKSICFASSGNDAILRVCDTSYSDAAALKASLSGVYLVYELATPTTETAQPYHSTQWVSDWGTEEFVSTSIVPVGSETRYPANLRDKLQHLPDAASGNGSYLITQTDGQMVLTPFPAPPSTAGNYVLKATVTNGVATYTWEVAT